MTDLEMIAEARAEAEREAAEYIDIPELHRKGMRLLELAETGALLAEVERRWMSLDIEMGCDTLDWYIGLYEPDGDGAHVHFVRGPTLTAALRDLLGVDGG